MELFIQALSLTFFFHLFVDDFFFLPILCFRLLISKQIRVLAVTFICCLNVASGAVMILREKISASG